MKTKAIWAIALVGAAIPFPAQALPDTHKEISESAEVFSDMIKDQDSRIPPALMRQTQAIAIISNVKEGGFIFGGRRGDGVMLSRLDSGAWSNPAFINLTGGSVGLQAGFQSSDLVLLFPSKSSLNKVLSGDFELGGSVSGVAGPVGSSARESLEGFKDDTVYVYSRSKGLFGGVTLEGSELNFDTDDTQSFYGQPVTTRQVFTDASLTAPVVVNSLKSILQQAE